MLTMSNDDIYRRSSLHLHHLITALYELQCKFTLKTTGSAGDYFCLTKVYLKCFNLKPKMHERNKTFILNTM